MSWSVRSFVLFGGGVDLGRRSLQKQSSANKCSQAPRNYLLIAKQVNGMAKDVYYCYHLVSWKSIDADDLVHS